MNYGLREYDKIEVLNYHILIKKAANSGERKAGDIFIPENKDTLNNKIGVGQIIQIGSKAKELTGLKENDYVLYDYFSAYDDRGEHIITKCENIIGQINEQDVVPFLNGMSII
jgi:co-chaperonin GroES (HSP10)